MMKRCTLFMYAAFFMLVCLSKDTQAQCSVNAGSDVTIYPGYAPLSCATLTATATGAAPFTFSWSNGSTGATTTVCNTTQTVYTVTVTDANGCTSTDQVTVSAINVSCGKGNKVMICHHPPGNPSNSQTICVSPRAVAAHLAHGDVLGDCNATPPPVPCSVNLGNDTTICSGASLVLDAGGGFSSYLWSDSTMGQTLVVTMSGTYWVSVMTATGCTARDSIVVNVNTAPVVTLAADSVPDSLGCRTITATISSGMMPYSIVWSNGDTTSSIEACDTSVTLYTVTVTDSNGCTASASITLGPPVPCTVNLGNDTTLCANGALVLDAGAGFSTYLWSDSSTAQTLAVTQSGTYWVQVTNAATGCTGSDTVVIVLNMAPVISLVADSLPDSLGCRNITAMVIGTGPFNLSWSTGDTTLVIRVCDTVTTSYVLMVTDSNGCSATDSITVAGPQVCIVDLGNDTTACGSWLLDAGPGFDTYLWSDSSTAQTLLATQSGSYWVQVTDSATGCTSGDTIVLTLFASPALTLVADSLPDSLGCRNITVLVTSGLPPFVYSWSTGDSTVTIQACDTVAMTYTVTVTDANGCSSTDSIHLTLPCRVDLGPDTAFCSGGSIMLDAGPGFMSYLWSDSSMSRTLTVTQGGTYWVTVSDTSTACTASDTINITVHALPVLSFALDTVPDSLGCRNLVVNVAGGTSPFAILWNTGDTTAVISACDSVNTWYFVTVTDSNGCPVTDSILVTKAFTCAVDLGADTAFCSGDSLLLDAGLGFLTYLWSDSSTAQTLLVTQTGMYWVRVTDSTSNCITSDTISVTVNPLPGFTLMADSLPDSLGCRNINVMLNVGTPPFLYSWSTGDTSASIYVCDTVTTTYILALTDSNGCSAMDSIIVVPSVPCTVNLGSDTSLCISGAILLDAGAGFANYLWSDSSTAQTLSVTQSGTYWVQVSDTASGCLASDTISLVLFDSPVVTAVADTIADSLGCFTINVLVSGGTAPFSYSWSNGDTTSSIYVCDTLPSLYIVTVTDSNGCMSVDSAMVNDTSSRPMIVQRRGSITVSPNPVLDNARISFAQPESGRVIIELYDLKGTLLRRLYAGTVKENTEYTIGLDGYDLIEGVYMLRMTSENGFAVNRKFVLFRY